MCECEIKVVQIITALVVCEAPGLADVGNISCYIRRKQQERAAVYCYINTYLVVKTVHMVCVRVCVVGSFQTYCTSTCSLFAKFALPVAYFISLPILLHPLSCYPLQD